MARGDGEMPYSPNFRPWAEVFDGRIPGWLVGQTRLGMLPNMFQQLKAAFKVPAKGCVPMLAGHAKSIQ